MIKHDDDRGGHWSLGFLFFLQVTHERSDIEYMYKESGGGVGGGCGRRMVFVVIEIKVFYLHEMEVGARRCGRNNVSIGTHNIRGAKTLSDRKTNTKLGVIKRVWREKGTNIGKA